MKVEKILSDYPGKVKSYFKENNLAELYEIVFSLPVPSSVILKLACEIFARLCSFLEKERYTKEKLPPRKIIEKARDILTPVLEVHDTNRILEELSQSPLLRSLSEIDMPRGGHLQLSEGFDAPGIFDSASRSLVLPAVENLSIRNKPNKTLAFSLNPSLVFLKPKFFEEEQQDWFNETALPDENTVLNDFGNTFEYDENKYSLLLKTTLTIGDIANNYELIDEDECMENFIKRILKASMSNKTSVSEDKYKLVVCRAFFSFLTMKSCL